MSAERGIGSVAAQRAPGAGAISHGAPENGHAGDGDDGFLDTPSGGGGPDAATAAVQVCVRFRPLLESEISSGASSSRLRWDEESRLVRACKLDGSSEGGHGDRTFEFDYVLGPDVAQEDVFDRAGLSRFLDRVVEGFHATVFAYGQTGSGKTHTMEGFEYVANKTGKGQPRAQMQNVPPDRLGLVPRAINGLFAKIEQCQLTHADVFTVRLSFLQIYNEKVFDLLNPGHMALAANAGAQAGGLRLRWNVRDATVTVENLFVFECRTAAEALEYYRTGIRNRAVSSHQMNQASSRSHCVLMLAVERASVAARTEPLAGMDDLRIAKLTLVDLAGSERQGDTGAAGKTLRESVSINQSLFVLRKVITALAKRRSQELALVPYRESKLTTLLRDAIGGSSYTLMIACTSPNDAHYEESLSTLHYAMTTGRIRNRPAVNLDPKSAVIRQLRAQVRALRQKLVATQTYAVRATGRPLPAELGASAGDGAEIPSGVVQLAWEAPALQPQHQPQHPTVSPAGVAPLVPSPPPMMPSGPASIGSDAQAPCAQPAAEDVGEDQEEWARLSKPVIASRLVEAVKTLHVVAEENFRLRRDREELEEETMLLRRRIEEHELISGETAEPGGAMLGWHRHCHSAPSTPWPVPSGLPMALWEIGGNHQPSAAAAAAMRRGSR